MRLFRSPAPNLYFRRALAIALVTAVAPFAAARAEDSRPPADSTAAGRALAIGLENVSADSVAGVPRVGYENRRYRHPVDVLGRFQRDLGTPVVAVERRLGLTAASVDIAGRGDSTTFRVRYPSDKTFGGAPPRPWGERTTRSVDFLLRPTFAYELGHLTVPIQVQVGVEPMVRYNPWTGARATATVKIPIYTQFDFDPHHPDADQIRPGQITLDQYVWWPKVALASTTVGLLGDNRWGGSVGLARPFAGGRFIADAQADLTGFIAFEETGLSYSSASTVSYYGGLTYVLPWYDCAARLRAGQFLFGDDGVIFDFRRNYGDFEYSLFITRTQERSVEGVRVTLPLPPMTRATQQPVRAQLVERWSVSYRTDATPLATLVSGVAPREEPLRQLSEPSLHNNKFRLERAYTKAVAKPDTGMVEWVNGSGTSGFVFTPWADVLHPYTVSVDYTHVPAEWAYSYRGQFDNQAYSLTVGLLPRIEASLRFTRVPGAYGLLEDIDNQITTDTDHMASGRLVLLTPRNGRPGLAIGIDDIGGTKRFHSTYAVAGLPLKIKLMQTRFSFGYAPHVFTATRRVLDGGFGALEVSPWRVVAAQVEYDSEKWNVGAGVVLPFGLRLRVSVLNLETLSAGAGWTHKL